MKHINIGGRQRVNPDDIRVLQADLNYTLVFFKEGSKALGSTTMGTIINRLPKGSFVRVSRGTTINKAIISNYYIGTFYDEIKLEDSSSLIVSRRRRIEIRKLLMN